MFQKMSRVQRERKRNGNVQDGNDGEHGRDSDPKCVRPGMTTQPAVNGARQKERSHNQERNVNQLVDDCTGQFLPAILLGLPKLLRRHFG